MNEDQSTFPAGYSLLLRDITTRIRTAQTRAALAVNRELVVLYWSIGRQILARQAEQGWGGRVIDQLAADLRRELPDVRSFSARNLKYMRAFAESYPDEPFVQQVVAQIPWGHNLRILDQVSEPAEREWYIQQTVEHGWSRNVLVHQMESQLYHRRAQALSNFARTLPPPQSDLAHQLLKDPYSFEFLGLQDELRERKLERSLLEHIRAFLIELGTGFAFVGSQYHLEVGGEDFYLDLLFYHPSDEPSIGIILCKSRNRTIVEYALRESNKPIGVASYRVVSQLPAELVGQLPAPEQVARLMEGVEG